MIGRFEKPVAMMSVTKSSSDIVAGTLAKNGVTVLYLQGAWVGRRFVCVALKPSWGPSPPKPAIDHDSLVLAIPAGHDIKNACLAFGASITRRARDRDDHFEHVRSAAGAVHIAHAHDHRAICGHSESWATDCVVEGHASCAGCLSKAEESAAKMYRARHAFA